ncbi:MAG: 3-hydroxyacyl-CoA dehydrogenase NAD-binding domain-containing protein [Chloroflexota bacterium]
MSIHTVGVIGAGVMGIGVAQNLIQTGHHVILVDTLDTILEQAYQEIKKNLRFHAMLQPQAHMVGSNQEMLTRITSTTNYEMLTQVDLVIENVTEKWDIKKEVYTKLDSTCSDDCIFVVNTSAISITRVASLTNRPKQVVGMHFMNPVPMKSTVEVIKGYHTSDETMEMALSLLDSMDKKGIVVNDAPGFVSNRVLMLTINEAIFLVQDQTASPEDIDMIFKTCFGHAMGPLETADLIGLDTILFSIEVLYESFNDSKYRPCPLLKRMVDAGLHGRKNGRGFYNY